MTVRVTGLAPSPAAVAAANSWLPRTVSWPLYVAVRGADGGYVELRSDELSGVLTGLVLGHRPHRLALDAGVPEMSGAAVVLDAELCEWKVTPDYREPVRRHTTMAADLSLTVATGRK